MKNSVKRLAAAVLALAMVTPCALTACSTDIIDEYELSAYKGENKDIKGEIVYNSSLFYSNSLKQGYADPQILDDTARSGYYYMYGTSNLQTMRSRDLAVWEPVTVVLKTTDEKLNAVLGSGEYRWAPEVVYDEGTELYYLFFSSVPYKEYKNGAITEAGGDVDGGLTAYCMYAATSASPEGPFNLINFGNAESCGAENVHNLNTNNNKEITEEQAKSGEYAFIKKDGVYYEAAFRHFYADYCLFAPDELSKLLYKNEVGAGGIYNEKPQARYFQTIDPHPYVDPVPTVDEATGKTYHKKYMYFKLEHNAAWNINIGVEMENWLKPKWETAKYITADRFYTIQDWRDGSDDNVTYEYGAVCNEGASMLYHEDGNGKGLYYFTFSVNDYSTSDYQVGMAVSDSPLGDFRKLREDEGGLLLCSSTTGSESISGAGHHSFVTSGDQLYISYHRHKDYSEGGSNRYAAIDEVKWITVKDKDGNDMTVPYVNGPTDSVQPLPEKVSGYKNIASKATLTCTDESAELEYLTDGLLSVHKDADETFMDYIRETKISKTATFEFAFDKAETVRAVMVYNSAKRKEIFLNIPRMEFTLGDGSVRVIRDVKFDVDRYCRTGGVGNKEILYVSSGAAAFAEFYDVAVTNIKITVELPENQSKVGLSEIKILGKA